MDDPGRAVATTSQTALDLRHFRPNPRVTRGLVRADLIQGQSRVGSVRLVLGEEWRRDEQDPEWFEYRLLSDGILHSRGVAVSEDGQRYLAYGLADWTYIFDGSGHILPDFDGTLYRETINTELPSAVAASRDGWIISEMLFDPENGEGRQLWSADARIRQKPVRLGPRRAGPWFLDRFNDGVIGSGFEDDIEYVIAATGQLPRYGRTKFQMWGTAQVNDTLCARAAARTLHYYSVALLDQGATAEGTPPTVAPFLGRDIDGWIVDMAAHGELLVTLESSKSLSEKGVDW